MIERGKRAKIYLHNNCVMVFSNMLVNKLGNMACRHIKTLPPSCLPSELGLAVRQGMEESIPWLEYPEFVQQFGGLPDPVTEAFAIPEKKRSFFDKNTGNVSIGVYQSEGNYSVTAWVKKGSTGSPIKNDYLPLSKTCSDAELGSFILKNLEESLHATLLANAKKTS